MRPAAAAAAVPPEGRIGEGEGVTPRGPKGPRAVLGETAIFQGQRPLRLLLHCLSLNEVGMTASPEIVQAITECFDNAFDFILISTANTFKVRGSVWNNRFHINL